MRARSTNPNPNPNPNPNQVVLTDSGPMLKVDLAATTMLAPMSVLDFVAYKLGKSPAELDPQPCSQP